MTTASEIIHLNNNSNAFAYHYKLFTKCTYAHIDTRTHRHTNAHTYRHTERCCLAAAAEYLRKELTHLIYKGKTENTHKYYEKYFTFVVDHSDCKNDRHTYTRTATGGTAAKRANIMHAAYI